MVEPVSESLSAYLDAELDGLRLREVEDHLESCRACRAELESLRGLSKLLGDSFPAQAYPPTERFISNLIPKLPRRAEAASGRKGPDVVWWLVPAAVLGAWVLIQTSLQVSTLVTAARLTGLLRNSAGWFPPGPEQADWFSAIVSLFGNTLSGNVRAILGLLDGARILASNLALQLAGQAAIGLLYWAWLAVWLTGRRRSTASAGLPRAPSRW